MAEESHVKIVEDVEVASTSVISKVQEGDEQEEEEQCEDSSTKYHPLTFRLGSVNSQRRHQLLPAYPFARNDTRPALLLLANVATVDRDELEKQSFCGGQGICPFQFRQHGYVDPIDSFLIDFYRNLYLEPSRRWKIHLSLIDYNLTRLRRCMEKYTKQTEAPTLLSFDECLIALEFFLQIDVDLFFMKTCNFRGAYPRLFGKNNDEPESILCQAKPSARYGMKFCCMISCFLCERVRHRDKGRQLQEVTKTGVDYRQNHVHTFVNKYQAILNCEANCLTTNVIYVLTCPCGQCDFIGSTSMTFQDRMLKHRDENNRIVREFLIGANNIDQIIKEKTRSAETVANNKMFLYQHSPRCSLSLQLFLNKNPEYWCLVPMTRDEARLDDKATASSGGAKASAFVYTNAAELPDSPTFAPKPKFFQEVLTNLTRSHEESVWLSSSVPKPPAGFRFSRQQIEEQINFFKFKKEARVIPSNLVDFYKYTIVAVLPDECSHELRQFIEALFITHAETQLNTIGRLTRKGAWPSFDTSNRGTWCDKLVRRHSS